MGEPINKEAWQWFYQVVGEGRCALVDTWWQTGKRRPWGAQGTLNTEEVAGGERGIDPFQFDPTSLSKNPSWLLDQLLKASGSFCT